MSNEERDRDRANMQRLRDQQRAQREARQSEEAAIQRAKDQASDEKFKNDTSELFGGIDLSKLADVDMQDGDQVRKRIREIQDLQRRGKGDQAAELYRRNQGRIKKGLKSAKKAKKKAPKKKSGCAVISILLLGGLTSALASAAWFAHDMIGALIP